MTPTRGLSPFFVGGHLRLADKLLLKSYDALPVGAIPNGALLVPGVLTQRSRPGNSGR